MASVPTTGLVQRLEARQVNGAGVAQPAHGTAVQSWVDLSPASNWITQGTSSLRPLFDSSGPYPFLDFDAADDWMQGGSYALSPMTWIAALSDAGSTLTASAHMEFGPRPGGIDTYISGTARPAAYKVDITSQTAKVTTAAVVPTVAPFLTTGLIAADGAMTLKIGGAIVGTATGMNVAGSGVRVGKPATGRVFAYALMVWDRVLTDAEQAQVHSYLQDTTGAGAADYVPPAAPTNLTLNAVRATEADPSWTASSDAVSYEVSVTEQNYGGP